MAVKLPNADDLGARASLASNRPIAVMKASMPDYSAEGRGAQVLARGVQDLGNAIMGIGSRLKNAADVEQAKAERLQVAQADAAYRSGAIRLNAARDDETDPAALDGYRQRYQQNLDSAAAAISNPEKRELWRLNRSPEIEAGEVSARNRGFNLRRDQALAGAFKQLEDLQGDAAKARTDEDRNGAISAGHRLIDELENSGYLGAQDAAQRRKAWASGYAVQAFRALPAQERLRTLDGFDGYKNNPKAGQAMAFFMGQGWTREQAAGLVGNLLAESGLDTRGRNPGDGKDGSDSIGIAQWNSGRAVALKAYAASRGKPWDDFQTQLEFIQRELQGSHSDAGAALKSARTVQDAAAAIVTKFEKPAGSNRGAAASHNWSGRLQHSLNLARAAGGATVSPGEPTQIAPYAPAPGVIVGDSHAVALRKAAGVPGFAMNGLDPHGVFDAIVNRETKVEGQVVLLSTGVANANGRTDGVEQQILALKKLGAAGVVVLGVGPKYGDADGKLKAIAEKAGATFQPLAGKFQKDGVHLTEYDGLWRSMKGGTRVATGPKPAEPFGQGEGLLRYVSPDQRRTLRYEAEREVVYERRQEAEALRSEVSTLKSLMKDDTASIASAGKPVAELTPDRVAKAMGPDAAEAFARERARAQKFYDQTNDLDRLPHDEIVRRVAALKPEPGKAGFIEDERWHEAARQRASEILKERQTDPAKAADRLPEVQQARESGATLAQPEAFREVVRRRLIAQDRLGIPEDLRSPITREEARQLWQPLATAQPYQVADALRQLVGTLEQAVGRDNVDEVLANVLREGHADKGVRDAAARLLRKLAQGETPSPAETRAVDEAMTDAAADRAVAPVAPPAEDRPVLGDPGAVAPALPDGRPAAPAKPPAPTPDAEAIEMLRANPGLAGQFDQVYGAGAAERVLAVAKPR